MLTLNYFEPWDIDYSYRDQNAVQRTGIGGSKKVQGRLSHRKVRIAEAVRVVNDTQKAYFEHFIRVLCNYGADKFIDYYADGSGAVQGAIRIVDGSYQCQPVGDSLAWWRISCQIEVF